MEECKSTVLIVDDEEPIRSILCRKLELDGYNCEVAADGKEALCKASMRSFDLVLLDVNMPCLSGLEVLRRLIAGHPDICVIMITAIVDVKMYIEALKLGAYDYVTKPFDLDDVSTRVKMALEIRRLVLKKGWRQSARKQSEAIKSLICGQISLEEFKTTDWAERGQSTPGEEFAIPTFGLATHPQELTRHMQMAQKLLFRAEIFRASIPELREWASLLGEDIANQPGNYNGPAGMTTGLHIAATSCVSDKIHIPDYGFIDLIPWTGDEGSDIKGQPESNMIMMPDLEHLRNIILSGRSLNRWQTEPAYCSGAAYRLSSQFQPGDEEIVEAFVKLSQGKCDSSAANHFLQLLGRQAMTSQLPAYVPT